MHPAIILIILSLIGCCICLWYSFKETKKEQRPTPLSDKYKSEIWSRNQSLTNLKTLIK